MFLHLLCRGYKEASEAAGSVLMSSCMPLEGRLIAFHYVCNVRVFVFPDVHMGQNSLEKCSFLALSRVPFKQNY